MWYRCILDIWSHTLSRESLSPYIFLVQLPNMSLGVSVNRVERWGGLSNTTWMVLYDKLKCSHLPSVFPVWNPGSLAPPMEMVM